MAAMLLCARRVQRYSTFATSPAKLPLKQLAAAYDPAVVEKDWYGWWRTNGLFARNDSDKSKPEFTMLWPPANVTGSLHIGHALTASIQDAIVRWRRMSGDRVSWIPGSDHAGIATQVVVERRMYASKGLTRHDLGREKMLEEIWEWCKIFGGRINTQLHHLGVSLDWDREYFTLDKTRSEFVDSAFVRMFEQGLIYRTTRMVNWCCHLRTVISDIEVDAVELQGRTKLNLPGRTMPVEFGILEHFAYRVYGSDEEIIVATTRLETMLADAAVAVHPEDLRYKHLCGRFVQHPITGKLLQIIADPLLVDPAIGTGAVKVTPAHDFADYDCGLRHALPNVQLFRPDGTLTDAVAPEYAGLDRYTARERVREQLKQLGVYRHAVDHPMVLSVCSRSGDVLEPMLLPQWYIRMGDLSKAAADAVHTGRLSIEPSHFRSDWLRWLEDPRDWCISRQLWWGHRVPAYRLRVFTSNNHSEITTNAAAAVESIPQLTNGVYVSHDGNSPTIWIVATSCDQSEAKATKVMELLKEAKLVQEKDSLVFELEQDADVLDTWFSAGLLPMSALTPNNSPGNEIIQRFNTSKPPLALMETGSDILFFWVARMVMLTQHLTNTLPFDRVYLHSMVRDAHGRKMSKTLGNVIDPLDVVHGIDRESMETNLRNASLPASELKQGLDNIRQNFPNGIAACGADALRLALIRYPQHSRFLNLDVQRVTTARLFGNKLWNATKFVLGRVNNHDTQEFLQDSIVDATKLPLFDRWILSRLAATSATVNNSMQSFQLHEGAAAVQAFLVADLCDVYIEAFKDQSPHSQKQSLHILLFALDMGLRLLHPFMPFLTEELWQHIHLTTQIRPISISVAPFPNPDSVGHLLAPNAEVAVDTIKSIVHATRSLRQSFKLPATQQVPIVAAVNKDPELLQLLQVQAPTLLALARASSVEVLDAHDTQLSHRLARSSVMIVSDRVRVAMPLDGTIDVNEQLVRMQTRIRSVQTSLSSLQQRLNNPSYEAKVAPAVREKDMLNLSTSQQEFQQLTRDIALLEQLSSK